MSSFRAIMPRASAKEVGESFMFATVKAIAFENGLFMREVRITQNRWLIIEGEDYIIPNIGPYRAVRVLVNHEGNYKFQVHNITLQDGRYDDKSLDVCLSQMKPTSGFSICPGLEDTYSKIKDTLKNKPIKLREWPGQIRFDHHDCKLWYDSSKNPRKYPTVMCPPCCSLVKSMRQTIKRAVMREQNPVSSDPPKTTPLKFLAPEARRRILTKRRIETYRLIKKLKEYENSKNASVSSAQDQGKK